MRVPIPIPLFIPCPAAITRPWLQIYHASIPFDSITSQPKLGEMLGQNVLAFSTSGGQCANIIVTWLVSIGAIANLIQHH
jgi:hypothetical protein